MLNQPSDLAKQHYQGAEGRRYHQAKRAIPDSAFPWVARLRAQKIASQIRSTDVVLEYGVGLGWNLSALSCTRKIGLDVGEFLEALVRQRGIEFVGDPGQVPEESVDVVLSHHTLEHAWQPAAMLQTIHRLLKPSGRLLLFVPYERERKFRAYRRNEPNHHLFSWNPQTLGNLVEEAGFKVQAAGLGRFGQERFAAILATRLHLGEAGFRLVRWLANSLKLEREVRIVAVKG